MTYYKLRIIRDSNYHLKSTYSSEELGETIAKFLLIFRHAPDESAS